MSFEAGATWSIKLDKIVTGALTHNATTLSNFSTVHYPEPAVYTGVSDFREYNHYNYVDY